MGLIQFDKPSVGGILPWPRSINEASNLAKNLVDGFSVGPGRPIRHRKAGFATVAGGTVEQSRLGPLVKLSGSSSGIQIPSVPITGATALQVTGVVRISSQNGEMIFEQSATADSNAGFYLYGISSTDLRLQVHNGASSAIFNVFAYTFPSGPVVITVRVDISANPARGELWVDGKLIAAYTVTLAAGAFVANSLNIGCRNGTSLSSDGAFGDVWVHTAWTPDALLALWHLELWSIYKPRRIWVPMSAGGDVSLALSGAAATSAAGNTSAGISTALTGVSSTAATGTLAASISAALTGVSSTAATGTLATATSVALSGISSTSAAGTLATATSVALSGVSSTAAAGALSAGGDASAAVTGQAASTAQGTLGVTVSGAAALSGASVAASAGTLSAGISTALTGASAAVSTGSLVAGGDVSVTIAGQAVSTAQGTVGVTATGAVTVALTGAAAVIAAGNIFVVAPAVGWTPVDDSSAVLWTDASDSDPNAWIPVDDSNAALRV